MMLLFAVCILAIMVVPSGAQTIGIQVGDYFTYEGDWSYETNTGTGGMVPYQISEARDWANITQLNMTVASIDGNNITFNNVYTFSNGSDPMTNTTTVTVNGLEHVLRILVIPSASQLGDEVANDTQWLNGPVNITEDTFMWGFGESGSEVDRLCLEHRSLTGSYATVDRHYWWDSETGILVRRYLNTNYQDDSTGDWSQGIYNIVLVATNKWTIPEFPTGTVMLLMFVALAVSIGIYQRKKLKI